MITDRQPAPSAVVHADVVHDDAVDVLKRAEIEGWVEVDRPSDPGQLVPQRGGGDRHHRVTTEQLGEPVEIDFCDHRVLVPSGVEDLLGTIYGASWRTPTSGFDWRRDRTLRNREGLLTDDLQDIIYWAAFYATKHDHGPSLFATEIVGRVDLPDTVIDLGCGDGRDIETLASGGRRVIGVDRSPGAHAASHRQRPWSRRSNSVGSAS